MIDIICPVLSRPHRVVPLLASIAASTSVPHSVLFVTSPGDTAEVAAIRAAGARHLPVSWAPAHGDFAMKQNAGFAATSAPFVLLAADDLEPQPGWDVAAIAALWPDGYGVCGTDDGANPQVKKGLHSTHPVVSREYINECGGTWHDGPGVVYHQGYHHQWVDSELVTCAKDRGCWVFAPHSVVLHHHPFYDKHVPIDSTYAKALDNDSARHDARLFQARRRAA